ncbi:hypothetical protein FB381_1824 [Nocardioides albertanoniae]|uniref:Uncharacterized protein n=1 Tax=Nocardioides albertanoniae TaxID=1175486 RepID=A0A543A5R9_9ACTN|nr:hypothetical protein [Nocardioides albertanoniae]TQL67935.1 hypothetical protein FB381_1824 [Nocardioides albertanoniae]
MSVGKALSLLMAVVLLVAGGALALTGMGYLGGGGTSTSWSIIGAALAGFGVALAISSFRGPRG